MTTIRPIKVLIDEQDNTFIPFTTATSTRYDVDTTVKEKLDAKLETSNLIAGEYITITPIDNGVIIGADMSRVNSDKTYLHIQSIASDTWIIPHNLNKYPAVSVIDSAGNEVEGDIIYNSVNQITIMFKGAFKGSATLN